jgi:hypothetical protein
VIATNTSALRLGLLDGASEACSSRRISGTIGRERNTRVRYGAAMKRAFILCLLSMLACDSKKEGGDTTASAATDRPAVEVVVRKVALQKTITKRAKAGGDDEESWDALDEQVYAIVTTEIAHNGCKDGDKIDIRKASIVLPGGKSSAAVGGGTSPEEVCVLCQASEPAGCSGGRAPLKSYTFVFSVPEKADASKLSMKYDGREAALSGGEITDKRGNDELDKQIKEKEEKLAAMKKELENTGSKTSGEILISEMEALKKEIDALKAKRR